MTRGPHDIGDFGQKIRIGLDGNPWIVVSVADDYVVRIVGNTIVESPHSPECDIALARAADGSSGAPSKLS